MAPYRENRFQRSARRFSEFYYAKWYRSSIFIACLWLTYFVASSVLRSNGHPTAALSVLVVYFVLLVILVTFPIYGLRQKRRKSDYEFEQKMSAIHAEFEEMLASIRSRSTYGVPDGHVGHDVIEGEVVEDEPAQRMIGD